MGRRRIYKNDAAKAAAYRRRKKCRAARRPIARSAPIVDCEREIALARFQVDPTKAYQRHIREVMAEHDPRPPLPNLRKAVVSQVSVQLAATLVLRYEWLATMAAGTRLCYGLWPSQKLYGADDLLGVVCFAPGANRRALESVAPYDSALVLSRGCCTMRAGRNAASFLISRACKLAARDHGVTHFLAYSDPDAGERGTIYRALGWKCLGVSEQGDKSTFISPEGERVTSYGFNTRNDPKFYALGWNGLQKKYDFLRSLGWCEVPESKKLRWLYEAQTAERTTISQDDELEAPCLREADTQTAEQTKADHSLSGHDAQRRANRTQEKRQSKAQPKNTPTNTRA